MSFCEFNLFPVCCSIGNVLFISLFLNLVMLFVYSILFIVGGIVLLLLSVLGWLDS
mgnify:CR=1 FL=1